MPRGERIPSGLEAQREVEKDIRRLKKIEEGVKRQQNVDFAPKDYLPVDVREEHEFELTHGEKKRFGEKETTGFDDDNKFIIPEAEQALETVDVAKGSKRPNDFVRPKEPDRYAGLDGVDEELDYTGAKKKYRQYVSGDGAFEDESPHIGKQESVMEVGGTDIKKGIRKNVRQEDGEEVMATGSHGRCSDIPLHPSWKDKKVGGQASNLRSVRDRGTGKKRIADSLGEPARENYYDFGMEEKYFAGNARKPSEPFLSHPRAQGKLIRFEEPVVQEFQELAPLGVSNKGNSEAVKKGLIADAWDYLKDKFKRQREEAELADAMRVEKERRDEAERRKKAETRAKEMDFDGVKYTGPVDEKGLPHGEGVFSFKGKIYGCKFEHGLPVMSKGEALAKGLIKPSGKVDRYGNPELAPVDADMEFLSTKGDNYIVWPKKDRGRKVVKMTDYLDEKPRRVFFDEKGVRHVNLRPDQIKIENR